MVKHHKPDNLLLVLNLDYKNYTMKTMRKNLRYCVVIFSALITLMFLPSCKDFLNPDQDLNVTQEQLMDDWYEYRSVAMGLYGLQQQLVEQLVVLGELRGDLLAVTPNADADLIEIYNFQASKNNKYSSPTNFYKLISACNSFLRVLKSNHPELLDTSRKSDDLSNYDRLYGEVLCMRAWAYFNAVRIYGKVPVIHESLTSVEEIEQYMNSSSSYVDTSIVYARNGYDNIQRDTIITLTKQFYDTDMVIQIFTKQLEEDVKAVGVNHYIDNQDISWEVTIWNTYAWHALLGQMYLTSGDLIQAVKHFEFITKTNDPKSPYRYQLAGGLFGFSLNSWSSIFTNIDIREHILTLPFNKANKQQNNFQRLFEVRAPHDYMLKPTKTAVHLWETTWRAYNLITKQAKPELTILDEEIPGFPSDVYRGFGTSYTYVKSGVTMTMQHFPFMYNAKGTGMLNYKMENDVRSYSSLMEDVDTIVSKYSINKTTYDQDANFIIYRAGGIHLYLAEIYTWWAFDQNGLIKPFTTNALSIVNNGSQYNIQTDRAQMGVRGRVGFLMYPGIIGTNGGIQVGDINYKHDPFTNEVIGFTNLTGKLLEKQLYLEEQILDERARELAFEGERFYDLMRVANRRNDPSFLAKKVSAKYPAEMRESMYNLLLDKKNWYINAFD